MIAHSSLNSKQSNSRGLSIVEVVLVVTVLGIIATLGTVVVSDFRQNAHQVKVTSGLSNLNSAVAAYLSNGGDISDSASIADVIAKLKTVNANSEDEVGFNGSFIDRRIAVEQSEDFEVGIQWNPIKVRFEETTDADRFQIVFLDEETPIVEEDRDAASVRWGENWIWEFDEDAVVTYTEPTVFTIIDNPTVPTLVYDGPSVVITPVDNDLLSVGLNSARNAGYEDDNGGFEFRHTTFGRPSRGPVAYNVDEENVNGWQTTATDGLIEIWQSGFSGVDAFEGNFFAEFNANEVSTLFQEVNVAGSDYVNIFFAHGQRSRNTEQLALFVGPNPPARKNSIDSLEDLGAQGFTKILETNSNSVQGFTTYQDRLDISSLGLPANTNRLYFAFQSIGEFATRSIGNFLDDVRFEGATLENTGNFVFDIGSGNSISNRIQSARVTLQDAQFEDNIVINNLPEEFTLERMTSGAEIQLTITGEDTRSRYSEILQGLEFTTTSPVTAPRTIAIQVNDGFALSNPSLHLVEFEE